jgi:hypothetical protein
MIINYLILIVLPFVGLASNNEQETMMQKEPIVFPQIKGDLLSGGKINLPDYFQNGYSLVSLVYEVNGDYEKAQKQSLKWQDLWRAELKDKNIGFYELPMISKGKQWMSFMTNIFMQNGIPESFHPNVITVYGEKENLANLFGIVNTKDCFTLLLNERKEVIAKFEGSPKVYVFRVKWTGYG